MTRKKNSFKIWPFTKRIELEFINELDNLSESSSIIRKHVWIWTSTSLFMNIIVNSLASLQIELLVNVFVNMLANSILDYFCYRNIMLKKNSIELELELHIIEFYTSFKFSFESSSSRARTQVRAQKTLNELNSTPMVFGSIWFVYTTIYTTCRHILIYMCIFHFIFNNSNA